MELQRQPPTTENVCVREGGGGLCPNRGPGGQWGEDSGGWRTVGMGEDSGRRSLARQTAFLRRPFVSRPKIDSLVPFTNWWLLERTLFSPFCAKYSIIVLLSF